jgi:DMSO/TMAO reductase YedYZ molybdopterin-dependent catalytic subunit
MIKKLISILFFLITIYVFIAGSLVADEKVNKEIRSYQGKHLSSIDDFRENSIKGPRKVDLKTYRLEVTGLVGKPLNLTYEDVLAGFKSQEKVIRIYCVEGWKLDLLWEGLLLKDLLVKAEVKPGAKTVIFHSDDGYTTSIELDYILKNNLMLAYKINGLVLPPERGFPFQVAAEGKWGYKWAKWVTKIEISSDASYEGYWEKRGYNRNGDVSGPIFE